MTLCTVSSGLLLSVCLLTCQNLHPQGYASQPSKSIVHSHPHSVDKLSYAHMALPSCPELLAQELLGTAFSMVFAREDVWEGRAPAG